MPISLEQNIALQKQIANLLAVRFPVSGISPRQRSPGAPVTGAVPVTPPPSATKPPTTTTTLPPAPGEVVAPPQPTPIPPPPVVLPPPIPLTMQNLVRPTHAFVSRQTVGSNAFQGIVWGPLPFPWRIRRLEVISTAASTTDVQLFLYQLTGAFANYPTPATSSDIEAFPIVPAGWTLIEPVTGQFTTNLASPDRRVPGLLVAHEIQDATMIFDLVTQIYLEGTGFAYVMHNTAVGANRVRCAFTVEDMSDVPSDQAFVAPYVAPPVVEPGVTILPGPPPPVPGPGPGPAPGTTTFLGYRVYLYGDSGGVIDPTFDLAYAKSVVDAWVLQAQFGQTFGGQVWDKMTGQVVYQRSRTAPTGPIPEVHLLAG